MKRSMMSELVKWKDKKNRKPLLLTGVRQCGKTYIAKQFGEEYFESVSYVYGNLKSSQLLLEI